MLITILRYEIMIFIDGASPAGLSCLNGFFSIDALGSSSTIRFEPIEQETIAGQ